MLGFKVLNRDNHIIGESIGRVVGLIGVSAEYIRLGLAESETKLELISYRNPTGRPLHSNNANTIAMFPPHSYLSPVYTTEYIPVK